MTLICRIQNRILEKNYGTKLAQNFKGGGRQQIKRVLRKFALNPIKMDIKIGTINIVGILNKHVHVMLICLVFPNVFMFSEYLMAEMSILF